MNEVSNRVACAVLDAAAMLDVDVGAILRESGMTEQDLRNPLKRMGWENFVRFLEQIAGRLPAGKSIADVGRLSMLRDTWKEISKATALIASPSNLYFVMCRWGGPSIITHIVSRYRVKEDGTIEIELEIPEGYSDSRLFFDLTGGTYEAAPAVLGLAMSRVDWTHSTRSGVFRIQPPRSSTAVARLKRAWKGLWDDRCVVESLELQGVQSLQIHEAQLETRRNFLFVIEQLEDAVVFLKEECVVYANESFRKLVGADARELMGSHSIERLLPLADGGDWTAILKGDPTEVQATTLAGRRLYLEIGARRKIQFEEQWVDLVQIRDVTSRKESEKVLVEQQKLAALGELSAGIAHDIKNPLAAIRLASQILLHEISNGAQHDPEWTKNILGKVQSETERIEKIVNTLTRFARQRREDPWVQVEIGKIVQDALSLLADQLKMRGVEVRYREEVPSGEPIRIQCRPEEISQVLLNLFQNSIDAMDGMENKWLEIHARVDADEGGKNLARVSVTDGGRGLDGDLVEKIFQSFFTTKPRGKGTGLGLSISRRIIEEHGGSIDYDPTSKNTCFRICLPLSVSA